MVLHGDGQKIELSVVGYEYPEGRDNDWDNNWLLLDCQKTFGRNVISGTFPCFTTWELERFQRLLGQFAHGDLKRVCWGGTEPNLAIDLCRGGALEIFFYPENGTEVFDQVSVFRKTATDEDVLQLLDFCRESLLRYPVRALPQKPPLV